MGAGHRGRGGDAGRVTRPGPAAVLSRADARRSVPAGRGRLGRRMGHLDLRRPHARARLHLRRRVAGQSGGERRAGPPCALPGAGGRLAQSGVVAGGQPRAADRGLPARLVRRPALPGRCPAAGPDHGRSGPAGAGGGRDPERSQRRTRPRAPPVRRARPAGRRPAPCPGSRCPAACRSGSRGAARRRSGSRYAVSCCAAARGSERPGRTADGGRRAAHGAGTRRFGAGAAAADHPAPPPGAGPGQPGPRRRRRRTGY